MVGVADGAVMEGMEDTVDTVDMAAAVGVEEDGDSAVSEDLEDSDGESRTSHYSYRQRNFRFMCF